LVYISIAQAQHLKLLCATVGDRNVLELMQKEHMCLGGEQSGHVIFLDYATTGDGQLTALQFLSIVAQSGKKVSELTSAIARYPQVLKNVRVGSNEEKSADPRRARRWPRRSRRRRKSSRDRGRVLVRASGTEPLIRVMVEAGTEKTRRGRDGRACEERRKSTKKS
jgi:phosphoglucosamine mutase